VLVVVLRILCVESTRNVLLFAVRVYERVVDLGRLRPNE